MVQQLLALASGLGLELQGRLDQRDPELAKYMEQRGFLRQGVAVSYRVQQPVSSGIKPRPVALTEAPSLSEPHPAFLASSGATSGVRDSAAQAYPFTAGGREGSRLQRFSRLRQASYGGDQRASSAAFDGGGGQMLTDAAADAAFALADLNRDGVVDRQEFRRLYARH